MSSLDVHKSDPGREPDGDLAAFGTVDEIAALLRNSGHDALLAGAVLGLVVLGLLIQADAIRDVDGALAPIRFTLLTGLVGGLLRTVGLLVLTGQKLMVPLGELRRLTAASPKEGWRQRLGPGTQPSSARLLEQVRLTVAAAYDRHSLAHGALSWAMGSFLGLVLWTALNIGAGVGQ